MRQEWFDDARFGMFVHFGLYSGAARHEWVQNYERLTDEEYRPYFDNFDPDLFDAAALAKTAKETGMGYVVLTTKHHDGFCLWDSKLTDFTSVAAVGRDLVREYVDALRAEGIRVGLYHSVIDWHHPDFTVDWNHPRRDDENAHALNEGRDMARYREYLHGQVRELLTGYGDIDYLFFDFTYPESKGGWEEGAAGLGRRGAARAVSGAAAGDARQRPARHPRGLRDARAVSADGSHRPRRRAPRVGGMPDAQRLLGYHRDNTDQKSPVLLAQMLVDSVSMGGNMLLNIGPDGRGAIAPRDAETLAEIGSGCACTTAP